MPVCAERLAKDTRMKPEDLSLKLMTDYTSTWPPVGQRPIGIRRNGMEPIRFFINSCNEPSDRSPPC